MAEKEMDQSGRMAKLRKKSEDGVKSGKVGNWIKKVARGRKR
jgi:hypothetical protein